MLRIAYIKVPHMRGPPKKEHTSLWFSLPLLLSFPLLPFQASTTPKTNLGQFSFFVTSFIKMQFLVFSLRKLSWNQIYHLSLTSVVNQMFFARVLILFQLVIFALGRTATCSQHSFLCSCCSSCFLPSSFFFVLFFLFLPCLTFSRTLTFSTLPLYFSNFMGFLLQRPRSIPIAFHILA